MASKKVVETIYGKYSKYEIVKKGSGHLLSSTKFYVKKDGSNAAGPFSSLKAAVKWAENKG